MGRKKALKKRQARLQNKINDLTARSQAADVTVRITIYSDKVFRNP